MSETAKTIDRFKNVKGLELDSPVSAQDQKSLRMLSLDVLRAVAVLLVLGRHMMSPPLELAEGQRLIFKAWQRGGWVGVDLFFVLSGFLVSRLLFSEFQKYGQISAGHFYLRRGLKIYPAFYVLLTVSLIAKVLLNDIPSLKSTLAELFFVQNYIPGIWNHTWSLAVEEHFYLMLPLLLKCFLRFGNKPEPFRDLPKLILLFVVAILAGRLVSSYLWGYDHYSLQFQTHSRLDGLLIGVLISWFYTFRYAWLRSTFSQVRHHLILVGSLLLGIAFVVPLDSSPFMYTFGFSVFALASATILIGTLMSDVSELPATRFLGFVGSHSYSIYLWHLPFLWLVLKAGRSLGFGTSFWLQTLLYIAGSLAIGIIMARLVEYPLLKLRDRWFPSRSVIQLNQMPLVRTN